MKYEVKGFGIDEYGVEWGIETDDDGNSIIIVSDANDSIEVSSESEAVEECERLIEIWKYEAEH